MARSRFVSLCLFLLAVGVLASSASAQQTERAYVVGHVNMPGAYTVPQAPLSVGDLLNLAGGPTHRADLGDVSIVRRVEGKAIRIPSLLTDLVQANDTLEVGPVPRRAAAPTAQDDQRFYIIGWIQKPGSYQFAGRVTIEEAIAIAGGIAPVEAAATATVVVRRRQNGVTESVNASLSDVLQPADVIFINRPN